MAVFWRAVSLQPRRQSASGDTGWRHIVPVSLAITAANGKRYIKSSTSWRLGVACPFNLTRMSESLTLSKAKLRLIAVLRRASNQFFGSSAILRTSFPRVWCVAACRCAAIASLNGRTCVTIGLIFPASISCAICVRSSASG